MNKLFLTAMLLTGLTFGYLPPTQAAESTTSDKMAQASTTQQMLSDGESAEVLVSLNEGEIDIGQLAKRKANHKQVKDYAKMMVDQHKNNEKETKRLVRKQDLKFKETELSESVEAQAEDNENILKKTAKNDFDMTYINQQISRHQKSLETLDTLISSAKNDAYKVHLQKTRDAMSVHLAHAKEIQSMLK